MNTGLRKILIGSAALFLLIALVAPGISATTAPNTSADAYSTDSAGSYNVPPSPQPPASNTDSMNQPDGEIEEPSQFQPESLPIQESEPSAEGVAEPESAPEEILPDIPSEDTNPDEPDSSYPTFQKVRGKSNPQRHGDSGNAKKVK